MQKFWTTQLALQPSVWKAYRGGGEWRDTKFVVTNFPKVSGLFPANFLRVPRPGRTTMLISSFGSMFNLFQECLVFPFENELSRRVASTSLAATCTTSPPPATGLREHTTVQIGKNGALIFLIISPPLAQAPLHPFCDTVKALSTVWVKIFTPSRFAVFAAFCPRRNVPPPATGTCLREHTTVQIYTQIVTKLGIKHRPIATHSFTDFDQIFRIF